METASFDFMNLLYLALILSFIAAGLILPFMFRRVVPTNEVHIVQSAKKTTSYGKSTANGNTYYQWPSWIPVFGVNKVVLPTSVFDLDLESYEAYDQGRLPFLVDIKAFFRVSDSNMAAERVSNFDELKEQLKAIVQGAVRTILASTDIEQIMQGRSQFGDDFTKEVSGQLSNWGVQTVKNIELMDLRDAKSSLVIHNIMEKKKSHIEMESRQEVAKNNKQAAIAEIEAKREIDIQKEQAAQQTGLRTVEARRAVSIADQEAQQLIKEQQRLTKQKEMQVIEVEQVASAEIAKKTSLVKAAQDKEVTVTLAEGQLQFKKLEAEGITVEGEAKANAEKAMQLAPVEAQIVLAKEIGGNESYQKYLITIEQVKASQAVGIEQAKALTQADVKIIANTGDTQSGIKSVMDLFTAKGGTNLGGMVEAFKQTGAAKSIVDCLTKEGE